ncbi:dynamin family protein [Campylobacter sp.]|uniref:dynamin family protein n=1 Tax=Campylobacter sp. TaxID=205 RepID=UPI002AA66C1D|nr:dynamin family protein [Campylobacter sp.]MCI7237183.1 dynamin family protein [Campylobacter sp.]
MQKNDVLSALWGVELLRVDYAKQVVCDAHSGAIVLCANESNIARLECLPSFTSVLKSVASGKDKYNIQSAQAGILNALENLKMPRNELILALSRLNEVGILDLKYLEVLKSFMLGLNYDELSSPSASNTSFKRSMGELNEIAKELSLLCNKSMDSRLQKAINSANNANFSLALSGVVNAGKSSLLNALIAQNLLGVSNVPQTAAICALKYSDEPYAKIEFFSTDEQEQLPKKELKDINISLDELPKYTAASSELAQYVKLCTLGINAEILSGIDIIDTPGIDDAIKAREELSANYLKSCDSLLYLMNAAQAASAKDMAFLRDIVLTSKNSEILVLLTHIDKLSEAERLSVLEYTQRSVLEELGELNEELAKNIKYFLVSAPANIGINELKAHLFASFFGESSKKAGIILNAYKKELGLIAGTLFAEFENELRALNASGAKANDEISKLKAQASQLELALNDSEQKIANITNSLKDEKISTQNEISAISSKIADRVMNEVKYRSAKKQKADNDLLFAIANSAISDFLIDLFRDKRRILELKLESFALNLKELLNEFSFKMPDFKEYIGSKELKIEQESLKNAIKEALKSSDLSKNSSALKSALNEFLSSLDLEGQIISLLSECAKDFKNSLENSLKELKEHFASQNEKILEFLSKNEQKSADLSQNSKLCAQNLNKAKELKERLEKC